MLIEDSCQTVSPDFVRDAVLYLVRLLHGVVATSDAILTASGQPGPALASSSNQSSDRSAP
jgi:ureidoacrylate peracid hydrolase